MIHKHIEGLSIEILSETNKGYKVKQTELFAGWSGRKLRIPKVKICFYSGTEIKNLFIHN